MSAGNQFTEAHLADGTTLRLRGQLTPDQVKQKVAAYRAGKAGKIQGDDTGIVDPTSIENLSPEQIAKTHWREGSPEQKLSWKLTGALARPQIDAPLISGSDLMTSVMPSALDPYGSLQRYASSTTMPEKQPQTIKPGSPYAGKLFEDITPLESQEGLKHGAARAATDAADVVSSFTKPSSIALMGAGPLGKAIPAISPIMKAAQIAGGVGMGTEGAVNTGEALLNTEGDTADRTQQALMGLSQMFGGAAGSAEPIKPTMDIMLRKNLGESAHRMLSDAATKTKQLVGQGGTVERAASQHFENLANSAYAKDYANTAATGKKISMTGPLEKIMEHADDFAAGKTTPNFNAIADIIQKSPSEVTLKQLHDMIKEAGTRWDKTSPGTRDAGAAGSALSDMKSLASSRAADVGASKSWSDANTLWRTLKEYQGSGALADILKPVEDPASPGAVSGGGKEFFDKLRDPANVAKLKEINTALEPYGIPPNYFTDLSKSHAPLHNLVAGTASGGGMFGRTKAAMRAIKENPAVGIPAVAAGTTIGSVAGGPIGGTLGAIGALRGVERLSAARAIRKLGGVPPEMNPLAGIAKPSETGTVPKPQPPSDQPPPAATQRPLSPKPAPVPTVNEEEIVSALANQGYPKKAARSMAQRAIQDNPHDFDEALKAALGQKTKASAIEDIGEEARRGGPGTAPTAPDTSQTFVRPSKSGTQQGIADQVKVAKAGKQDTRPDARKAAKGELEKKGKK